MREWVEADDNQPCDADCFAEISAMVLRCVYNRDHEELSRIHSMLSPLSAKLSRRLRARKIPTEVVQSAEIPALAAMVRGTLHIMEKDDPQRAVELIRHGSNVLSILLRAGGNLRLDQIRDSWPDKANKPSTSTISRTLSAMEEAGFIHRSGITKGRMFRVLDKAWRWDVARLAANTERSERPETQREGEEQMEFDPVRYMNGKEFQQKCLATMP